MEEGTKELKNTAELEVSLIKKERDLELTRIQQQKLDVEVTLQKQITTLKEKLSVALA